MPNTMMTQQKPDVNGERVIAVWFDRESGTNATLAAGRRVTLSDDELKEARDWFRRTNNGTAEPRLMFLNDEQYESVEVRVTRAARENARTFDALDVLTINDTAVIAIHNALADVVNCDYRQLNDGQRRELFAIYVMKLGMTLVGMGR